ncbi:integrase arm-type DNA-binding domain-containing protein [Novosphingobium sp. ST904]|uniref:tyrosine-type recombinase/integrase n=1 Tax=Novosphingobium sp. ST904 TaxID=1684385 RepID=UPI0006C83D79|nr:integrase arm-type DNA-binding domain-containing protein [Novosphingobium sp. ST904]KPH69225.1 integrase [Novosphingobium sp. ST904]
MLTDKQVANAKPKEKAYKLNDSGGLFLYVAKSGLKSWRMKFKFDSKEKLLTFGSYPDITLKDARSKRDQARVKIQANVDPSGVRTRQRQAREQKRAEQAKLLKFEAAARAWFDLQSGRWAPVHAADVINSLERDVFPTMGALPIVSIDAPTVLKTLRRVESRGAIETARRLRQRISAVFAYSISEGICANDPAAIVGKALKPLPKKGRQPALTDPEQAREVLVAAEASGASPVTKLASRFLALTAARPGMVRGAEWDEFENIDWSDQIFGPFLPLWRVPASRMKLDLHHKDDEEFEHVIPLSWQAVEVLRATRQLTGKGRLVFPGERHSHRPLCENAIGYLYNRVGFYGRHVPHGWRSSFSTTMNARAFKFRIMGDPEIIELMLAHMPENRVKAAYDRAGHMERRRELSQEWADILMIGMPPAHGLLEGRRRN